MNMKVAFPVMCAIVMEPLENMSYAGVESTSLFIILFQ
jgi:hypothetical protein